jgi:GMP synthase (glutamine-hydrolysing)
MAQGDRRTSAVTQARILVIDGNRAATREQQVAAGGQPSGEGYAQVLHSLAPVRCDIVRPADGEVHFSSGSGLASYDGVAITGSALSVYDEGAHIERQIELARAVFSQGLPFFGSCWGLQVAICAVGGRVQRNPLGREFGFARRIEIAEDGRHHPMFTAKPAVFEAIAVHKDVIQALPPNAAVLASNEMGIQAIELRYGGGTFWGVQYHPEYSFAEIAATALRYSDALIGEHLFADRAELAAFVGDLHALTRDPRDRRLTWKHGLGAALQDERLQRAELRNWLELVVLPFARERRRDLSPRGSGRP